MKLPFRSSSAKPPDPLAAKANVPPKPDAELAKAAQRGEKRAFVEIVARHQAMVCGIAYGILSDFAASEDAAQEAFLTAWRKIHDLRDPERLKPWLSQITRNAALGHLRRRHPERSLDEALEAADPALHPDEAAASDEEAALVHEALTKLPETFRLPLILFYREGQSVKSVAESLELSEDAVKQRLARGREMLRERMSGLIETVLTRTRPTAVFTMLIAAAIGALTAPAVIAGTAFTAAATSASVTSATTAVTAMSTSKTSLMAAALVAAVCLPLGYGARLGLESSPPKTANTSFSAKTAAENPGPVAKKTDFSDCALYAEWQKLHEEHGSTPDAMPALYKAISDIKDPVRRRVFRAAQIAEWAETDPEAGFAYFMGKKADWSQRNQFFDEWFRRDPSAAVNALVAAGTDGESLARRCLVDIAKRVPGRVAEIAAKLTNENNYWNNEVREAFAVLTGSGLESARTAAENLTGPNREAALSGVAKAWAKTNPDAAIAWAKNLPEGVNRDEIIRGALTGLASANPVAALDRVQSVPPGGRQGYFATTTGARVLKEAVAADYDATVDWLAQHRSFSREDMMGMADAVTVRLNADPVAFLQKHSGDGSLSALMPAVDSALLNQAAGQNLAIWEWLKTQPNTPELAALREQTIRCAAYADAGKAMKLADEFPKTAEGDRQLNNLAAGLLNGSQGFPAFDRLLADAPERLRSPLIENALNYLDPDNLGDPGKWLALAAKAPPAQEANWTSRVVSTWAAKEPEDAIAWASKLPGGDLRSAAVVSAANAWIQKDPYGASAWVDTMPAGRDKDQASASLVSSISKESPSDAWEWAMSISDPDARSSSAVRVLDVMAKRDPVQAHQWLDAADLPAESKARIGELIDRGGAAPPSSSILHPLTPPGPR